MSRLSLLAVFACLSLHAADFPAPFDTEKKLEKFLTPEQALRKLELPQGFQATLCAAEPDVQNPIAMTWDARGRLWVAENYTYGENAFDLSLRDRILIFEDTDGDGRFDKRKVFTDEVQHAHEHRGRPRRRVGGGLAAPAVHPGRDGDDIPDGAPVTHLEGFHVAAGELSQLRQRPALRPGRLALRPLRGDRLRGSGRARHRRRR